MAIIPLSPRSTAITLASATPGPFEVGFRLLESDALLVYVNDAPRMDYTVSPSLISVWTDDATITFTTSLVSGDVVRIEGRQKQDRPLDLVSGDPGLVVKLNAELSALSAAGQEHQRGIEGSVRVFGNVNPVSLAPNAVFTTNGASEIELMSVDAFNAGATVQTASTKSRATGLRGGSALWLGTSIPAFGLGSGDSYPELIAEKFSTTRLENMAFAGTQMAYDRDGDPDVIQTVKCLSMTADDVAAGLALHGPGSAYDDAFDPVTKASRMTADFNIIGQFATGAFTHVLLDHNFNDKRGDPGAISHPSIGITGVTKGATTTFALENQIFAVGDPIMVRVTGIPKLDYLARRVQSVSGNSVTVNWDSTAFTGTFANGTARKPDRDTIHGAWDFVIYSIRWAANLYDRAQPLIILSNSPSNYQNGAFQPEIKAVGETIRAVADKWALPYFDVATAYEIDQGSHLAYLPDDVHPSTPETRQALAALWENWLAGGNFPTVNPDTNVDLSAAPDAGSDQVPVAYDRFTGKHRPMEVGVPPMTQVLAEAFAGTLAGYTLTGAVSPVIAVAPWGAGNALQCVAASGANSYITKAVAIGESYDAEFDLYLPTIPAVTSTQLVTVMQINTGSGPAWLLQVVFSNNDGVTEAQVQASWYPVPGALAVVKADAHPTLLTAATRHVIRVETRRATDTALGGVILSVDGVEGGGSSRVLDADHTNLTQVSLGIRAHNVTAGITLHMGNVTIGGATTLDVFSGQLLPGVNPLFINGLAFGDATTVALPQARLALGYVNIFDTDGSQLTYSQAGDWSSPRRGVGGDILALGPDGDFMNARITTETVDFTSAGYALEPGTTGFAVLMTGDGQSGYIGATSGEAGLSATAEYNTLAPLPGQYLCFNNGPFPLDASTGGVEALATALDAADIATVVDCADYINPLVQRDTAVFSAGLVIADALRGTPHKVFTFSFAIGSTSFNDRLYGFKGSRADGTVTITGTSASITVANGSLNAQNLILVGTGIAAGTFIVTDPAPTGLGTFPITVSPSQTVGPVAFVTEDQKQQQYKNFIMALDAFAAWARGQGLTPIMPCFLWIGGEAESDAASVATGRNLFADLREVVNEFTTRLYAGTVNAGQTAWIIDSAVTAARNDLNRDPLSNEFNDTPSEENMGLASNIALASLSMARDTDALGAAYDTQFISCAGYHYPATADARVHIGDDPIGHLLKGEDLGLTALQVGNGLAPRWPSILNVQRVKGSRTVTVTFSEACEFDTRVVANPGQYGLRYIGGTTDIPITGFDWDGAVLTLTLGAEPSGTEVLTYACDNAVKFRESASRQSPFGPVSGGLASGGWPWDGPGYGLGATAGQRGNIRAVTVPGYSKQIGRPMYRFACQQKVNVNVTAGTGNILAMHTTAGITPSFLIDIGDAASYPGTGQTVTDRSASAALYWLGIDGTATNDPAYVAAANDLPAWLLFDGGGGAGVQSDEALTPQASPTFLDNLHKAGGEGVLIGAIYLPSAPNYASTQYLLANCRNDASGQAGVALRITTAGQPGFNMRGAAGSNVLTYNMPTAEKVVAGWNVFAIGIKDGATGWSLGSNGSRFNATINTYTCTYTTPSALAPEGTPRIGMNLRASVALADTLINGAGIGAVGMAPWMEATAFLPVFRSVCARFGLPVGRVEWV